MFVFQVMETYPALLTAPGNGGMSGCIVLGEAGPQTLGLAALAKICAKVDRSKQIYLTS